MKKFIITAFAAALFMGTAAFAEEGIAVYSNGNLVADEGIIVDGRTLVPVRGVFEYLGYDVIWDSETKTASLTSSDGATVITLTNGDETFTVNGEIITPDVPQQIINSRFMLPLRAVGEAAGAEVKWDAETKTAYISAETAEAEASDAETSDAETSDTETTDGVTDTGSSAGSGEETGEASVTTETIGGTTITSEIYVPFVRIEGIDPEEVPDGTVEIEVE